MNWTNILNKIFAGLTLKKRGNKQHHLIFLICIPCLVVAGTSLYLADISVYLIIFVMIILLLIATYVIIEYKRRSEYQIRTLSNLIESMIDGDYSLRGRLQTDQAFKELLNSINDLAETLSKHKIEAKESRLFLERIMEQMDALVIAINEEGLVVMANASANKLLLGDVENFSTIRLSELSIGEAIVNSESGIIKFDHPQLTGEHFLFTESFLSEGKSHRLFMLTNAERLLMEKERNAWQSLLRVLSHEMNNSLAPIASISQSMQTQLQKPREQINFTQLMEGVNIINERAESLNHFIASYSQLSHLPHPNKKPVQLGALLAVTTSLFPQASFTYDDADIEVNVDKEQFEQVLINIFKNSIEAMTNLDEHNIQIYCSIELEKVQISVTDSGCGIANLDNIFVPFYTTKTEGSGIGLALCRQIMFNHSGSIDIANNANANGVTVSLSLPLLSNDTG